MLDDDRPQQAEPDARNSPPRLLNHPLNAGTGQRKIGRKAVRIEHRGQRPQVDPTAFVAPTAVACGNVRIGSRARILFFAVLTAEEGEVEVGGTLC
jgi:hypothetical protein